MESLLLLGAFVHFIKGAIMLLFILTSFLLITVVLLQEGKGGGLAGAFGGAGAQTFGVQTGGVSKFTFWVAGVFMILAVLFATIKPDDAPIAPSAREDTISAPDNDGDAGGDTDDDGDPAGDSGAASGGDESSEESGDK